MERVPEKAVEGWGKRMFGKPVQWLRRQLFDDREPTPNSVPDLRSIPLHEKQNQGSGDHQQRTYVDFSPVFSPRATVLRLSGRPARQGQWPLQTADVDVIK